MPVVRIPTPLRGHTGGKESIEVPGGTVGEALDALIEQFPDLRERLFDGEEVRRFVNIYTNNEDIRFLEELETVVAPKDEISIIPAIAGG